MPEVRVFFHNHCFDGSASAAVFTALYRHARGAATFSYQGLTHKASGLFDDAKFTGDANAIVDFKYSSDPRVTWWFDHHQSAFLSPADAAHFRQDHSGQKFYDPNYGSCTQFIADVGVREFGFDPSPLAELIHWADLIDRALFPSAAAAVQLKEPALKLALAIEGSTNPELLRRLIPDYLTAPLETLLERDYVQRELEPLLERHWKSLEIIHQRLACKDGVIAFDVSDLDLEGYNKFIPYYFCPEGIYSIGVSRSPYRMKVSVGSNPWYHGDNLVNLAELCERYGGGGHARVGAISFPSDQPEQARAAAREVVELLRGTGAKS
ncbi:MAG: DHH family phosphoesterase [Terriglobales bacterium]